MEGDLAALGGCASSGSDNDGDGDEGGRIVCGRCDRPANACLCDALPDEPIRLERGCGVIVLQHPNERKRKLATVPVLTKALGSCDVLVGRKFRAGQEPVLDEAYRSAREGGADVFVLYPGPGARDLAREVAAVPRRPWTLVAIDGTWQQAKEMFKTNEDVLLPAGVPSARRVSLRPPEGGIRMPLRTEPERGCMTTMEAVASALGVLSDTPDLEPRILAPLAKLYGVQKGFSPSLKARAERGIDYKGSRRQRLVAGGGDGGGGGGDDDE